MPYNDVLVAPGNDWVDATGGAAAAALALTCERSNPPFAEGVLIRFQATKPDATVKTGHFFPSQSLAWLTIQLGVLGGRAFIRSATDNPVKLYATAVT